ncbi:hypothetical protein [Streptomyces sp. Ru71]|uniref:hypothetical protein n=1 Tax=Streptomyces sp. Ru71 TaxID=2080746 RepID=UPI002156179E|nr:hypothetical protein [Streptomyces sp. Ru71]
MTQGRDKKRIDLSLPQVAGSAVAAVVAAKLASSFGVYGTILGAGVVSAIATCGGTVFQHFFKQTGEQLRTVAAPRPREQYRAPAPGEYTEGTVHRARVKGWKRPVLAAAVVFGVTMAGVTAFELVSGNSFSGGKGTTVSDAFTGRTASSPSTWSPPSDPGDDGTGSTSGPPSGAPSAHGGTAPSPAPSGSAATTPDATPSPTAGATEDGSAGATGTPGATATATPPAPGADSRSGSADPDPTGPAAP